MNSLDLSFHFAKFRDWGLADETYDSNQVSYQVIPRETPRVFN